MGTFGLRRWRRTSACVAAAAAVASVALATSSVRHAAGLPGLTTPADYTAALRGDDAWLAGGHVPGRGTPWAAMSRDALRDLHHLTPAPPLLAGPAAGAAPAWGLTWPRDAAFTVVAMARTGHAAEALAGLAFLEQVQYPDGGFAARYQLNGRAALDDRPDQLDGGGWALWALDTVSASAGRADRVRVLHRYRRLLDRATAFTLSRISPFSGLPPASPDYWERPEDELTLGVAAPMLAGLQAAARMYGDLGDASTGAAVARDAGRLEAAIVAHFAPGGYQRYGDHGGVDAAVCFLAPPFVRFRDAAGVTAALAVYQRTAARSSGGLAPGAGWRDDGISWTPETALVALTAATNGDPRTAQRWLTWLDLHRVGWGSLPERIRPDGAPAGPAPLAWTSAVVVLTLQALGPASAIRPALSPDAVTRALAEVGRAVAALGGVPRG